MLEPSFGEVVGEGVWRSRGGAAGRDAVRFHCFCGEPLDKTNTPIRYNKLGRWERQTNACFMRNCFVEGGDMQV